MGDNSNEKRNAKDIECISWVVVLLFNLTTDFNLHPSVNFFKQTSFTLLHTSNKSSIIDIFYITICHFYIYFESQLKLSLVYSI